MNQDMTKGSPLKLILLFTLPLVIGNILQQMYQMADTYIVSQTLGVNAFAAVGSTHSINVLVLGLAIGLTSGLSVITAQRFGKKDEKAIRENLAASVIIAGAVSVVLTVLAVSFRRNILEFMNTPHELIGFASDYLTMMFIGLSGIVLFNLVSNLLRAIGNTKAPLVFLAIASVLNVVLDLAFILVFDMGVAGAGLATVIAQFISGLIGLVYIKRSVPLFRIHKEDWSAGFKQIKEHSAIAFPMGFQTSLIAIGMIVVSMTLNTLGPEAVAATTAAQKIDSLATKPLMAIGVTMATYTAQNYGADKLDRVWEGVQKVLKVTTIYSVVVGAILIFFGQYFALLFVGPENTEILEMTRLYFITNSAFYVLLSSLIVHRYTLQGLGKSTAPTLAGLFELFGRVGAVLLLSKSLGFVGVGLSNPIAWVGALFPLLGSYYALKRQLTGGKTIRPFRKLANVIK
ncbi:putative efflux protein, MATE family [Alkalibacterium putridalgicola]|uniref:Probable multidrug resistance protein NorM n=1 Tax=Alkalibacterium putridalgicola TaxID=426703 RepID=A0A1H7WZS9_9LACT|nr:MATE family efflux transporter [Alkalibacterium putridalgicola]GEK88688.1 MATE family efflux transporter [Alkalibacterium putridalgicola]SEM26815.1 putative efflux protein, MATE family [Alkalibacterium putridalgicola]